MNKTITYTDFVKLIKGQGFKVQDILAAISDTDKPVSYNAFNRQNKPTLKRKTYLAVQAFIMLNNPVIQAIQQGSDDVEIQALIDALKRKTES